MTSTTRTAVITKTLLPFFDGTKHDSDSLTAMLPKLMKAMRDNKDVFVSEMNTNPEERCHGLILRRSDDGKPIFEQCNCYGRPLTFSGVGTRLCGKHSITSHFDPIWMRNPNLYSHRDLTYRRTPYGTVDKLSNKGLSMIHYYERRQELVRLRLEKAKRRAEREERRQELSRIRLEKSKKRAEREQRKWELTKNRKQCCAYMGHFSDEKSLAQCINMTNNTNGLCGIHQKASYGTVSTGMKLTRTALREAKERAIRNGINIDQQFLETLLVNIRKNERKARESDNEPELSDDETDTESVATEDLCEDSDDETVSHEDASDYGSD
jgi:hypothetical protein